MFHQLIQQTGSTAGSLALNLEFRAFFVQESPAFLAFVWQRNFEVTTLFDPFVMVGGDRRRQQGTGLGLAICRELTERMGGTLQVESEVGVGSAFTVSLPDYRLSQSTTSTV